MDDHGRSANPEHHLITAADNGTTEDLEVEEPAQAGGSPAPNSTETLTTHRSHHSEFNRGGSGLSARPSVNLRELTLNSAPNSWRHFVNDPDSSRKRPPASPLCRVVFSEPRLARGRD